MLCLLRNRARKSDTLLSSAPLKKGDVGMRRIGLLLASTLLAVLLSSGVALAITKQCEGNAICFGTSEDDTLLGNEFNNEMQGKSGNDTLKGFDGEDRLLGQLGNDKVLGGRQQDVLYGGVG
jgi:Ca2+-binding RTX toxin-like protein